MEEQIASLAAEVATLKDAAAALNRSTAEVFYYLTIPLMVLIHAGFLSYEMGASRAKNALASGIKNILAFAFIIPTFYFAGWWIYWAFPTGLSMAEGPMGISGIAYANAAASPIGEAMGPNLGDSATGVFFGAFAMFAATTASIMSGALIERIQIVGFTILAIALGSFVWILGAAWGWHADGWLVTSFGYHDFGASGVVHAIAGFFTLGVLVNLGPRIGKFNADGSANAIPGHSLPATVVGLMLIIAGFWGFLMACVIFPGEAWSWSSSAYASIYGTPLTLSALTFNILMGFAGGGIAAWIATRDPFWMMSGALGGIISVAAGLDLYWPPMAFAIAFAGGIIMPIASRVVERMGIDDSGRGCAARGARHLGRARGRDLRLGLSGAERRGRGDDLAHRSDRGCGGDDRARLRLGLCRVADREDDRPLAGPARGRDHGSRPRQGAGSGLSRSPRRGAQPLGRLAMILGREKAR